MDFQNRPGGKYGSGMMMSNNEAKMSIKERQKRLLMDVVELSNDPYLFKNHLGTFECRLCCTVHITESSYMAHTQGKKHLNNLQRRLEKEQRENLSNPNQSQLILNKTNLVRIGTPGFRYFKEIEKTGQKVIRIEVYYPEIIESGIPEFRIANCHEQKMEPADDRFLYLLVACNPYDTICFKIPNFPLDKQKNKSAKLWDKSNKIFYLEIYYI